MAKKPLSGFEAFLKDANEGWSFVAAKAPLENVTSALASRPEVLEYEEHVPVKILEGYPELKPEKDRRRAFLIQMKNCDWSILLRTIEWVREPDFDAVMTLAANLSKQLKTAAIGSAASNDGASCTLFENGQAVNKSTTDGSVKSFCKFFDARQIRIPRCFISFDGTQAALHLKGIPVDQLVRTDRLVLKA